MRRRGELEQQILRVLWDEPDGLSARRILDRLPGDQLALTTVLTVLERLRSKGKLRREGDRGTGFVYASVGSESDDVVATMLGSLTGAGDRQAALLRFAGRLDARDAEVLRRALDR